MMKRRARLPTDMSAAAQRAMQLPCVQDKLAKLRPMINNLAGGTTDRPRSALDDRLTVAQCRSAIREAVAVLASFTTLEALEEMLQTAATLLLSHRKWDPEKAPSFAKHLTAVMHHAKVDAYRKQRRRERLHERARDELTHVAARRAPSAATAVLDPQRQWLLEVVREKGRPIVLDRLTWKRDTKCLRMAELEAAGVVKIADLCAVLKLKEAAAECARRRLERCREKVFREVAAQEGINLAAYAVDSDDAWDGTNGREGCEDDDGVTPGLPDT